MLATLFLALRLLAANPADVALVTEAYDLYAECSDVVCDSADHCTPTWTSSDPTCTAVALLRVVATEVK